MYAIGLRRFAYGLLAAAILTVMLAGCGSKQAARQGQMAVQVKAMQVIQRDTPMVYQYVGQVQAKNEVKLRANVSGKIVDKMIKGGDMVKAGQPLFQIDRRPYEAAVLAARAQLAQAQTAYSQAKLDADRFRKLAEQQAIAQQALDAALAAERQQAALVEAYQAQLVRAENDLADTLVVAPFSGRIDVQDLDVGSYVAAGDTVLATISSVDPMVVQFSISENEYLRLAKMGKGSLPNQWGQNLKLYLSDGSEYPLTGKVTQVDRGLTDSTGTLTVKATFANPDRLLVPGMFARVEVTGDTVKGALLVPQRAVQQLLDKYFVTVVGEGNKAESRPVTLGPKIGNLWLVEAGLKPGDVVVVEGAAKVQPGTPLEVVMLGPDELANPAKQ